MTPEQIADRDSVWQQIALKHPEFTHDMDLSNNFHAVREIVLGGSLTWRGFHERCKIKPNDRVMDIGANVGIFSLFAAANGAKVTAYEPFLEPFAYLREAVERMQLDNLNPLNMAVWKFTGEIPYLGHIGRLEDACPAFNGGVPTSGVKWTQDDFQKAVKTKCVSFDDAVGDDPWDCVKIDIEGAEAEIILTASIYKLAQIKFMYVEFHPWISDPLYGEMIFKLEHVFKFEGSCKREDGRWEAAYLTAR